MSKIIYTPHLESLRENYSQKISAWNMAGVATIIFNVTAGAVAAPSGDTRLLLGTAIMGAIFTSKVALQKILIEEIKKTASPPSAKIDAEIERIAATHRIKKPEIYILDDPEKEQSAASALTTTVLSVAAGAYHSIEKGAFALPNRNNIMISREAYEALNYSECMAIVGHEWAHIKNRDGLLYKNLASLGKLGAFSLAAADLCTGGNFFMQSVALWGASKFCFARVNQTKEYRADMDAQILYPNQDAHITSLHKIMRLFDIKPSLLMNDFSLGNIFTEFFGSHPPYNKRQAQKLLNERIFKEDEAISSQYRMTPDITTP